jgi:hypothetical protein
LNDTPGVHHPSRRRSGGLTARGARAAAGDVGAAGLAGPRLTVLNRFIDELDLPFAGWRIEDDRCVARQTVETGDESRSVASRWDAAPDDDTI